MFVEKLPIPFITSDLEEKFKTIVLEITEFKKNNQNTDALETKLDHMVNKLFHLLPDEIEIIENNFKA